jgi:diguanylate cyclase (GGDEF)-like protein/PAS domain S-box-containing protein
MTAGKVLCVAPSGGGTHFRAGLVAAGLVTAGHLVASRALSGQAAQTESRVAVLVGALAMAVCCGLLTRNTRSGVRRGWMLVGLSGFLWVVSNSLALRAELASGEALPVPSLADIPSALAVVSLVLGVLSFLGSMLSSAGRMRVLLDGLLIASSMVFVAWALFLKTLLDSMDEAQAAPLASLAYPFGDVVLAALVLVTFPRIASRSAWLLLAGGLGVITIGHAAIAYFEIAQLAFLGGFEGTAWMIGCLLIGLSALAPDRDLVPATADPRSGGPLDIVVPLLPVAIAGGIGLNRLMDGSFDRVLAMTGAVIAVLLVVRQMLAQADFLELNRALESRIAERTEALSRQERQFRSMVQNSSDVVTIVSPDGTIRYQSASSTRVLGYGFGQLVGSPILDIVHPEAREQFMSQMASAPSPPAPPVTAEVLVRRADGRWSLAETTISNLQGDESVGGLLLTTRDISKRKALEEQLKHQAMHDPLTGLANRGLFMDRLRHAVDRASRDPENLAVLLLDLDGFKQVNDSLGHGAGDQLLMQVADRINDAVRPGDTVSRMGGDEFAVLLERSREEAPSIVAQRVLNKLRAPILIDGKPLVVQGSIGVAAGSTADNSAEELLRNADLAMYDAKAKGKASFASFVPAMHSAMLRRVEMEADLRRAINQGELLLHYQPLVSLPHGRVTGCEALVRWAHPEKGLISPGEFIPVAEESDLSLSLGRVVLNEACLQARRIIDMVGADSAPTMAVNLSSQQLTSQWLIRDVEEAIGQAGIEPRHVLLEITEGAIMGELKPILATLEGLKELGVQLAIDDFGTGWSSLSRLASFPVDKLKVDQSFISVVKSRNDDAPIAAAVVAMARSLHLSTVAEGVETIEQLALVDQLGCKEIQGFLFSKPLPRAEYENVLAAQPDLLLPGTTEILRRAELGGRVDDGYSTMEKGSLPATLEEVRRAVDADLVVLTEMHWAERFLVVRASAAVEGLVVPTGTRLEWEGSPYEQMLGSGVARANDMSAEFRNDPLVERGARCHVGVPVTAEGGVFLGTLSAFSRTPGGLPDHVDETLQTVGRLLAPDLEAAPAGELAGSASPAA